MKTELKKLKGTTIKTAIGEITLKQYYRQNNTDYDVIYFKAIGVDSICKLYDLEQAASAERFHNEMQQYSNKSLSMIYDRVHCEQIKIKKVSYGLVCFQKLDKELTLQQCMNSLSPHEKDKVAQTLIQMLQQLKQQNKIYCNIRPSNIYKCADKFVIINSEFMRVSGQRNEMDSFILETIQNNWEYWAPEFTDTYSTQTFDYSLDVYAVGCILYELVIGKYPFDSKLSSTNGQYNKIDNKNILYKIAQAFISKNYNRRTINFKDILAKLIQNSNACNYATNPNQLQSPSQLDTSVDKNVKKSNNGIFGNISNVFSKMMNDSEGWFLNYVEDDDKSPNQKYLDNILIKMYKKQQKADKLSGIIQKFVNGNSTKINSMRKVLLLIGQAIRKGPQAALHSLLPNVNAIKNQFNTIVSIQSFSSLLLKKIEMNEKFKKILSGNFYLSQISNFKALSIQDLSSLMSYLQYLIGYVSNKPSLDGSQLSQSMVNFACDEVYDLVSMIILSIISIRKDNQFQLRNDNLKQLQPIEKALNIYLRKLSSLSNFISAHAIYSLEGEYIPYQEEIMLKTTPYYSTLEYFYSSARSYKGLTVPTDYSQVLGSLRDQKKSAHSASKESKSIMVSSSDSKNYFKGEINSDDDDDFQKNSYGKIQMPQMVSKDSGNSYDKQKTLITPSSKLTQIKTVGYLKPNKNVCMQEDIFFKATNESVANKNCKNESTISFQQFGNLHKPKQKSPQKNFGDFFFFNDPKKQSLKKPPLPIKKQSKDSDIKSKPNQPSMKKSFVQFDQIFEKNAKKQIKKDNSSLAFTQFSQVPQPKNVTNFNAFDPFLKPAQSASPTLQQNPLVTKILEGLKLKQLKDLIIKNKRFVIDFSDLKLIKVIGSGSAGEVSYGKFRDQEVAIKKVKAKQNPNALKQFQRQLVTYMKIQSNPYLVSFVGVSQSNGDFYLVTQYCTSGSLFDILHKKKLQIVLPWKQRLNFAIQIAEGMHYLHSMKPIIIHRDLKSLNVFVTKTGKDWRMKVADFGLSRSPDADMMTTQLGTIHWMAPELLEGNQYSLKVDVYSYGILLWQILSRTTPYSNLHNPMAILKHVVIDKMRPNLQNIPGECPAQLINVMQKCWAHEPADRPTFSQILKQLKMINL